MIFRQAINAVGNIEACKIREGYKTALERTNAVGNIGAYMKHEGYRILSGYKIGGSIDAGNKIDAGNNQKENTGEYCIHLRILHVHPSLLFLDRPNPYFLTYYTFHK